MSIAVPDFRGVGRVEPSLDSLIVPGESAGSLITNPFVPLLLARFIAGPTDTISEHTRIDELEEMHDPEGVRDPASVIGRMAFRPGFNSNDLPGATKVRTLRVGAGEHVPTPAYLDLQSAAPAAVLRLTSIDKGTPVNKFRAKITAATTGSGRKIQIAYKDNPTWVVSGDNLGDLFSLAYDGNASAATVTLTRSGDAATRLQIDLTGASDGSVDQDIDLTSTDFSTVKSVMDFLNRQIGFTCTAAVSGIAMDQVPSADIDPVGGGTDLVDGPLAVKGYLGAIKAWVNANAVRIGPVAGVTAARTAGATAIPAVMAAFANFANGSQPAVDSSDWTAALAVIEREEIMYGMIFCDSEDTTVHELIRGWMEDQRSAGRIFRAAFGMTGGTTTAQAIVEAGQVNSERVALFHQRMLDRTKTERSGMYWAGAFAGAVGAINGSQDPNTAVLTSKRFAAVSIAKADKFKLSVREAAQQAGVNEFREEGGKVLLGIARTTYQGKPTSLSPFEKWSETFLLDWIDISIREELRPQQVKWATPEYVELVKSKVLRRLSQWRDIGALAAGVDPDTGAPIPAFSIPVVTVNSGAVYVYYDLGLVGEVDHVRIKGRVRRVSLTTALAA